jgi:ubiquinone/menaquinone biosynthesis C-methylase UbiE
LIRNQAHVRYNAAEYDAFTRDFIAPFDEALLPVVAAELGKRGPQPVFLDIGTGTARFPIFLARSGKCADARIIASDFFADMVEQAGAAIEEAGVDGIEVRQDDVHAIGLPSESADVILSRSTLHHWHSPVAALGEIFRVLKPGGIALILDIRRDAPSEAVAAFNALRQQAGLPPSFLEEKYTPAEALAFCEQAGLGASARIHAQPDGEAAIGMTLMLVKSKRTRPAGSED